jgi:hypothetical protein
MAAAKPNTSRAPARKRRGCAANAAVPSHLSGSLTVAANAYNVFLRTFDSAHAAVAKFHDAVV